MFLDAFGLWVLCDTFGYWEVSFGFFVVFCGFLGYSEVHLDDLWCFWNLSTLGVFGVKFATFKHIWVV